MVARLDNLEEVVLSLSRHVVAVDHLQEYHSVLVRVAERCMRAEAYLHVVNILYRPLQLLGKLLSLAV